MNASLRTIWPVIALMFLGNQAESQMMIDPSVVKFLAPDSNFKADAEFVVKIGDAPDVMPVKIAVLGNLTRVEMDMTDVRRRTPPEEAEASYLKEMKAAGATESVSICNPVKKCTYMILPRLQAYLQTAMHQKDIEEMKERPKAEKSILGEDSLGGRACTKFMINYDATRRMDVWRTWESPRAVVWIPHDDPACPLRMEVLGSDGSTNCIMQFKNIQAGKVENKLFEPPDGFAKYDSQEAFNKIIEDHWPNVTEEERSKREREAASPERVAAELRRKEERAKIESQMIELQKLADQTEQKEQQIQDSRKRKQ